MSGNMRKIGTINFGNDTNIIYANGSSNQCNRVSLKDLKNYMEMI